MSNEVFGLVGSNLIGVLLMIVMIFTVKANPTLQQKKVWKFSLTQLAYAMIVFFVVTTFIELLERKLI